MASAFPSPELRTGRYSTANAGLHRLQEGRGLRGPAVVCTRQRPPASVLQRTARRGAATRARTRHGVRWRVHNRGCPGRHPSLHRATLVTVLRGNKSGGGGGGGGGMGVWGEHSRCAGPSRPHSSASRRGLPYERGSNGEATYKTQHMPYSVRHAQSRAMPRELRSRFAFGSTRA